MSKLNLYTAQGEKAGEVELSDAALVTDRGEQAVHDAVLAYQANRRAGTHKTKKRGEVSGGGIKPFKQKGTGRARAGSIRSPIWRGGGTIFGPQPRDYSQHLNKRVMRLAFARAFSERVTEGAVVVVERFAPAQPKTRLLSELLKKLGVKRGALLVTEASDRNLTLAARNLAKVEVTQASDVNTYQILRYPQVVVSKAALEKLEQRMKKSGPEGGMKDPRTIIKRLLVTEKGTRLTEHHNQYQFEVATTANKVEIKQAVEKIFTVKVTKVNTMNKPGKAKRLRSMSYGRTSDWKRAVVTLKKGDKIDLT